MCKLCKTRPVYQFTNKRTVCARCFIRYFQKKFLYINRKFGLIKRNDKVGYENKGDFRGVVLEDLLRVFESKLMIELVKLRSSETRDIDNTLVMKKSDTPSSSVKKPDKVGFGATNNRATKKRAKLSIDKIATPQTTDLEADKIIHTLFKDDVKNLKKAAPSDGKTIKPLYLFTDKEVMLYAKLKKLKFKKQIEKKDKISKFIDELETKHPEIKRAVVKSYLKIQDTKSL